MPLFPSVPEDLEAVEADGLRELLEEFKTAGAALKADIDRPQDEREFIPVDMKGADLDEEMKAAITDRKRVKEALAVREEAEKNFLTEFSADLVELGVEDATPVELSAEDTPAAEEPTEPTEDPEAAEEPTEEPADELAVAAEASEEVVEPTPEPEPVEPVAVEPELVATGATVDHVQQVLDGTLDALGQAHHRPFSRG